MKKSRRGFPKCEFVSITRILVNLRKENTMTESIDSLIVAAIIFTLFVFAAAFLWKFALWIDKRMDMLDDKIDEILLNENPED